MFSSYLAGDYFDRVGVHRGVLLGRARDIDGPLHASNRMNLTHLFVVQLERASACDSELGR